MTFAFSDPTDDIENDLDYQYNPEEETIVLVEEKQMAGMYMIDGAECGMCHTDIDMKAPPKSCPGCDRDIIDYEEK